MFVLGLFLKDTVDETYISIIFFYFFILIA